MAGGAGGSDCKSVRTFSLLHVTFPKFGECDLDLLRFVGGVGSKYWHFCFRLYDLIDSSSVKTEVAADFFSASFSLSQHTR